MELLSKKEIEELTENYPLYSQDEKKEIQKYYIISLLGLLIGMFLKVQKKVLHQTEKII